MLLDIQQLSFSYSPEKPLFQDLNLQISEGKITAIAGESGCGKSTLLNLIYGLLNWDSGEIIFDGRKLLGPKGNLVPGEPQMKHVAQNFDLMPYATVAENVGKFISNIHLQAKKEKVSELLEVVGMQEFANVLPKNLSGGQQQRVAIARALSVTPKILLLDEPFSQLDYSRKIQLRESLLEFIKKEKISLLISTHEVQDIMPWLDQIIILQNGKIIQDSTPEMAFKNPINQYVAELFGEVNVFSDEEKEKFGLRKNFWFPKEIQISQYGMDAQVIESLFAGNYYWTKISLYNKNLILYTQQKAENSIKISFEN